MDEKDKILEYFQLNAEDNLSEKVTDLEDQLKNERENSALKDATIEELQKLLD